MEDVVRPFRLVPKAPGPPQTPLPDPQGEKLGLYPLTQDVIVSLPLFKVILATLLHGTSADRTALENQLREAYHAPFAS